MELVVCTFWNLYAATEENSYVLATGEEAKKTLDAQHKLFSGESYRHLAEAGLTTGKIAWDIGCGSGIMTEDLARIVGDEGRVYALDINAEQIAISTTRIEEAGLSNVTFITDNMATVVLPEGEADIVYGRFFLMHQRDPRGALEKMKSLLKPGGVIVLEESVMSSVYFSEGSAEFDAYTKAIVDLGKSKSVNYDIGSQLVDLCEEVGFERILPESMEFKLKISDAAPTLLARIDELRIGFISAGLSTSEEVATWKEVIGKAFSEAGTSSYVSSQQGYILAWK